MTDFSREPRSVHNVDGRRQDHTRLTYRFQGREFRLTDVSGNIVIGCNRPVRGFIRLGNVRE